MDILEKIDKKLNEAKIGRVGIKNISEKINIILNENTKKLAVINKISRLLEKFENSLIGNINGLEMNTKTLLNIIDNKKINKLINDMSDDILEITKFYIQKIDKEL